MATPPTQEDQIENANTMICIASARIGKTEKDDTVRINHKLIQDKDLSTSRFVFFLDAIASLSVSDEKSQVVAVALQIDPGVAVLTLAENVEVQPKIINYVKGLWTRLKQLSVLSPTQPDLIKTKKREICKEAYVYSSEKLKLRFTNSIVWKDYEELFLAAVDAKKLSGTADQWERGLGIISTLASVSDMMPKIATTKDEEWDALIVAMEDWIADVDAIPRELTDAWAVTLKLPAEKKPPALSNAIRKLTSHHRFILRLMRYAQSAAGNTDMKATLQVKGNPVDRWVKNPTLMLAVPGCRELITPFMTSTTPADIKKEAIGEVAKVKSKLGLDATNKVSYDGTVHCECTLIAALGGPDMKLNWPVRYIGVSKLSCSSCYHWIQAYNDIHPDEQKFYTRGTHGKWYGHWTIPGDPEFHSTNMLGTIVTVVGTTYHKFLATPGDTKARPIALADSTDAKGTMSDPPASGEIIRAKKLWTKSQRDARHNRPPPT